MIQDTCDISIGITDSEFVVGNPEEVGAHEASSLLGIVGILTKSDAKAEEEPSKRAYASIEHILHHDGLRVLVLTIAGLHERETSLHEENQKCSQ